MTKKKTDQLINSICKAPLPDIETHYKDTPRLIKNWDGRNIAIVSGYPFWFDKGWINPDPSKVLAPNTPINSDRSVISLSFRFPSLRGDQDPTYDHDMAEFLKKYKANRLVGTEIPESLVGVTIDRVTDWSKLPVTGDVKFWKTHFKPYLSDQESSRSRIQFQEEIARKRKDNSDSLIKYIDNYEKFGLREYPSGRVGLFYYEPINNKNPSPYGLPYFVCDAIGRIGVDGCVGHFKFDNEYLVTYQVSYRLMPCWQRVEEGVKRVVRLNTKISHYSIK